MTWDIKLSLIAPHFRTDCQRAPPTKMPEQIRSPAMSHSNVESHGGSSGGDDAENARLSVVDMGITDADAAGAGEPGAVKHKATRPAPLDIGGGPHISSRRNATTQLSGRGSPTTVTTPALSPTDYGVPSRPVPDEEKVHAQPAVLVHRLKVDVECIAQA